MKIFSSKKRVAVIGAITAVTLVGGGTAFAYFTATGTGTGTASVGTAANQVVVVGTAAGALTPGGPAQTVSFTARTLATSNEGISGIHFTGASVDTASAAYQNASQIQQDDWDSCVVSVFSMPDVPINPTVNLFPGAPAVPLDGHTGALSMADNTLNQDNCKNAPLALAFTTS